MIEIHWTEIDGVPTVWAEGLKPLQAGLWFRTGRADETLITAGRNHLVEHLALSTISDPSHHNNGLVWGPATFFVTVGQPAEVSAFFARLSEALSSLPGDRLANEKKVLAAEEATHQYDLRSNLLSWRYGAQGYGLLGMYELGRQKATLEQLQEHSARHFTRGNAVLWLSGPPPEGLSLKLPDGTKQPLKPLAPIVEAFPTWHVDDACGGAAVGATVPRVSASSIFVEIAARRLNERLRTAKALSYKPSAFYEPLTADTAHLVLHADSDPPHRVELAKEFGEVFEGFDRLEKGEVEAVQTYIRDHWAGPLAPPPEYQAMMMLQRAAIDWIMGREFESQESLTEQMMAVSLDDVAAFKQAIKATAMFALPTNSALRPWAGKRTPASILPVVKGREIRPIDAPITKERLVHGMEGVSLLFPDGTNFTVRYSDLAAAMAYKDGGVRLIGSDGCAVTVEPKLWPDGSYICLQIRNRIPDPLFLDLGVRTADSIPKPKTTAWQRFRYRLSH